MTAEAERRLLNLPNVITLARIATTPIVFFLAMSPSISARFGAFALFVAAGLSDVWDGYLARKYGWVTNVGKLLDPLADKLLMIAGFLPLYFISQRPGTAEDVPFWGPLPLWILVVIFGRELIMTLFRHWARRKGVVIAAGRSGKWKTLVQNFFVGGLLCWYPLRILAMEGGWTTSPIWSGWYLFHRSWIVITLPLAVVFTIYSLLDYLWSNRTLLGIRN